MSGADISVIVTRARAVFCLTGTSKYTRAPGGTSEMAPEVVSTTLPFASRLSTSSRMLAARTR